MEKFRPEEMVELTDSELDDKREKLGMRPLQRENNTRVEATNKDSELIPLETEGETDARVKAKIAAEADIIQKSTERINKMLGEAGYVPDPNAKMTDRNFDKKVALGQVEIAGPAKPPIVRPAPAALTKAKPGLWGWITGNKGN